jgi:hypothetical protein
MFEEDGHDKSPSEESEGILAEPPANGYNHIAQ